MLYYLFRYLDTLGVPGAGVFNYLSFRSAAAVITSLIIAMLIGKRIIWYLQRKQIGETIRNLDLEGQYRKQGTPSMGGLIIIASILVPVLLFARLDNVYIILMIITTIWVGFIGFMDDYIKIFKKNKEGLAGRFKIIGQIGLGLIVALTLYISDDVVVRVNVTPPAGITVASADNVSIEMQDAAGAEQQPTAVNVKSTKTTIPFVKNNEFDYSWLVPFAKGKTKQLLGWLVFMAMVVFVVVAVSNGVNLTDGLDGLATGTSAVAGVTLGILAYVSGNIIYANYLNIMYLPNIGELVIFAAAFAGDRKSVV
jgi:phospho-N-acetylmuramoyl-pentapeptide-transferase